MTTPTKKSMSTKTSSKEPKYFDEKNQNPQKNRILKANNKAHYRV